MKALGHIVKWDKRKIAKFWEVYQREIPESRIQFSKIGMACWGKWFIRKASKFMPPDRNVHILDAGAGHGELLSLFAKMGFNNLCGVDVSLPNLKSVAGRNKKVAVVGGI